MPHNHADMSGRGSRSAVKSGAVELATSSAKGKGGVGFTFNPADDFLTRQRRLDAQKAARAAELLEDAAWAAATEKEARERRVHQAGLRAAQALGQPACVSLLVLSTRV